MKLKRGKITFNLDLNLKNNEINNYEINGIAKLFAKVNNIKFEKSSFIYSIKKDSGEIDNLRGYIDGFLDKLIGNIQFDNTESLIIRGDIKTELKIAKKHLEKIV